MIMDKLENDGADKRPSEPRELGYGKPPRDKQFQKGRSGNPSGRPKAPLNVGSTLANLLTTPIVIREGGRRRKVTMFEALLRKVIDLAGHGNVKMLEWIMKAVSEGKAVKSLTDLMAGRSVFEFTPEEAAQFTDEKLTEGMQGQAEQPPEQPIL